MRPYWPKFFQLRHEYDQATILSNLAAGVTVGLAALPLSMAFLIASGLPPEALDLLRDRHRLSHIFPGGTRTEIGGPTGVFVVVEALIEHAGTFRPTGTAVGAASLLCVRFPPRAPLAGIVHGITLLIVLLAAGRPSRG